jgi:hypothetical protein
VIASEGDLSVEADPDRPSGRLLRQAGTEASYNDLVEPGYLDFDYLRWMRVLLNTDHVHRVLHIGGAGCALARALAAADPSGRQEVWEISPAVVDFAREHLGLSRMPGLRVRTGDGTLALRRAAADGASWDAVVIDAFVGARVAPGPTSRQALADAASLAALTLVNVVDDRAERELSRIIDGLAAVYPWVWACAGRSNNTVLAAGRGALDQARVISELARDPSPAGLEVRH